MHRFLAFVLWLATKGAAGQAPPPCIAPVPAITPPLPDADTFVLTCGSELNTDQCRGDTITVDELYVGTLDSSAVDFYLLLPAFDIEAGEQHDVYLNGQHAGTIVPGLPIELLSPPLPIRTYCRHG